MTLLFGRYETGFFTTDVNHSDLFKMAKMLLSNLESYDKHIKYYGKTSIDNFIKTYNK